MFPLDGFLFTLEILLVDLFYFVFGLVFSWRYGICGFIVLIKFCDVCLLVFSLLKSSRELNPGS